jgi:hypothetical protein
MGELLIVSKTFNKLIPGILNGKNNIHARIMGQTTILVLFSDCESKGQIVSRGYERNSI